MKIKNTGKTTQRVEGYGYVKPKGELTVPDDVGRQLCHTGSPFKEVKAIRKGRKSSPSPGQTRRSAPTEPVTKPAGNTEDESNE
jgi:hypothetical protein